jgi:hypothetical protein
MTTTAIIKIKTSLEELVAECLALFGEGARPDFSYVEEAFSLNNTPVSNGYIRVVCAEHIATALQWMLDTGMTSEHGEIIRVEWIGQDRVVTGQDEDGNDIIEEQLFLTGYTVAQSLEDGSFIPEMPVYLGRLV